MDQEDQIIAVQKNMAQLPMSMVKFSSMIRSLYSVNKVTGDDKGTKIFIEVRDSTRRNAIVYKDKVLPLTEEVIRHIGMFADSFVDFDYDEWSEGLPDILSDITKAITFCDMIKQLHLAIIEDLKKNEDKAVIGIEKLGEMSKQYAEKAAELNKKARELRDTADTKETWGLWTGFFTLGITTAILCSSADGDLNQAKQKGAEAIARNENAQIAQRAMAIAKNTLIPAVKEFVVGMEACCGFLVFTKETLVKMHSHGEKNPRKIYYNAMKKRAQILSNNSMTFLQMTDMMRTDINAIPNDANDKNYVDMWFNQETEKFKENNPKGWSKIAKEKICSLMFNH